MRGSGVPTDAPPPPRDDRTPGTNQAVRGGRHGQKLHSGLPPRQVDARGSADARSSADACLSQQKVQGREANRRRHRLTEPTTKALCQPSPPPVPCLTVCDTERVLRFHRHREYRCTDALLWSASPKSAVWLYCMSVFLLFNPLKLIRSHPPPPSGALSDPPQAWLAGRFGSAWWRGGGLKSTPPPLSAQISATTKRGCRPWAGSPWGPGNRGADLLLPLPPPPTEMGPDRKQTRHPPPACPRTLTAGRHMVIEVPPLAERGRTPNDKYVGIWDPHGNPAGGPPLPNTWAPRANERTGRPIHHSTPPPPSLRPQREGCTESAPSRPEKCRL